MDMKVAPTFEPIRMPHLLYIYIDVFLCFNLLRQTMTNDHIDRFRGQVANLRKPVSDLPYTGRKRLPRGPDLGDNWRGYEYARRDV